MTDGQSDEKGYQKMKQEGKEAKIVIPNGFVPGMKKLFFACFWVVCLISFGRKYPMEWTLGEEYANMSFLARFVFLFN